MASSTIFCKSFSSLIKSSFVISLFSSAFFISFNQSCLTFLIDIFASSASFLAIFTNSFLLSRVVSGTFIITLSAIVLGFNPIQASVIALAML